jgi:hypothetical protein
MPSDALVGASPSPAPPIVYGTVTFTWNFACKHTFTQRKTDIPLEKNTSGFVNIPLPFQVKSSIQKCPDCLEIDEVKNKEERDAAWVREGVTRAKEEALQKIQEEQERQAQLAKVQQQEARSLAIYKNQAASIEKHIAEAGDDEELRAGFTTMLKNCKLLWANKVKKTETERKELAPVATITRTLLEDKVEKINLMIDRAGMLLDKERGKVFVGAEKVEKFDQQIRAWKGIREKMIDAEDLYEKKVHDHLQEVEKISHQAWGDALKLMKEE